MSNKNYEKTNKQGKKYFEFNNLSDLSSFVLDETNYGPLFNKRNASSRNLKSKTMLGHDFFYFETMEEAMHALKCGWESGAKELNEKLNIRRATKSTFKMEYNVAGGQACVPRYLQGIPTNMILQKRIEKKEKIVNVYKSAEYCGVYTANRIIEEAVKAIEVVNELEKSGYRVNLYIVKYNICDSEYMACKIKVKNSTERLNLKKIAFCIANPDFQRRLCWGLTERKQDLHDRRWIRTYGSPIDNKSNVSEVEKKYAEIFNLKENDIFIPIIFNKEEFKKKLEGLK